MFSKLERDSLTFLRNISAITVPTNSRHVYHSYRRFWNEHSSVITLNLTNMYKTTKSVFRLTDLQPFIWFHIRVKSIYLKMAALKDKWSKDVSINIPAK